VIGVAALVGWIGCTRAATPTPAPLPDASVPPLVIHDEDYRFEISDLGPAWESRALGHDETSQGVVASVRSPHARCDLRVVPRDKRDFDTVATDTLAHAEATLSAAPSSAIEKLEHDGRPARRFRAMGNVGDVELGMILLLIDGGDVIYLMTANDRKSAPDQRAYEADAERCFGACICSTASSAPVPRRRSRGPAAAPTGASWTACSKARRRRSRFDHRPGSSSSPRTRSEASTGKSA